MAGFNDILLHTSNDKRKIFLANFMRTFNESKSSSVKRLKSEDINKHLDELEMRQITPTLNHRKSIDFDYLKAFLEKYSEEPISNLAKDFGMLAAYLDIGRSNRYADPHKWMRETGSFFQKLGFDYKKVLEEARKEL